MTIWDVCIRRPVFTAMFVAEVLVAFGRKADDPHRGFSGGGSGV